jgi:hypothetical protein
MMEIKAYKLVSAESDTELTKKVQEHIHSGWQPYGFPVAYESIILQAVVQYINTENITDI